MRKPFAALALAALAVPLLAQTPTTAPGAKDPARVKAGTYSVDGDHTQILFEVNHLGFSDYFGIFGNPKGSLTIDPARPDAAKVVIEVPISGVLTTSKELDEHLMKPDFFDAAKFPTATFQSTAVAVTGDKARITGNLTIRGITKPVVLDAEFVGAGAMMGTQTVGFKARTTIRRSDFKVSYGIPLVPDEVDLRINAAFNKPA